MNINERASYIKGLFEGMDLDMSKKKNKLLSNIVFLLADMAETVEDIKEEVEALDEVVDDIDKAVEKLEDFVFEDFMDTDDEEEDDDDDENSIICDCGAVIELDETTDPSDIVCPSCGEHIDCEIILDDEDETESQV
ncbi:MAG: hypothetical protein FWF15_05660 [Oscillospiraceae bacterium]|nr:hypothetical protein [Oscillospiraceae bacterium]